jgi:hypothetical protein
MHDLSNQLGSGTTLISRGPDGARLHQHVEVLDASRAGGNASGELSSFSQRREPGSHAAGRLSALGVPTSEQQVVASDAAMAAPAPPRRTGDQGHRTRGLLMNSNHNQLRQPRTRKPYTPNMQAVHAGHESPTHRSWEADTPGR